MVCDELVFDDEEAAPEVNEALRAWDARRARLYLLRDLPCPLCRRMGRTADPRPGLDGRFAHLPPRPRME